MPSWNIHMAQTERLFTHMSEKTFPVSEKNIFVFGNLVPDIFVGYMVPGIKPCISYGKTHFAVPSKIPLPNELEFWNLYIGDQSQPPKDSPCCNCQIGPMSNDLEFHQSKRFTKKDNVDAIVLGIWAHLATDNIWNDRTRKFANVHQIQITDSLRVAKQADFDIYGRTQYLGKGPFVTEELLNSSKKMVQYPLSKQIVIKTCAIAQKIVEDAHHNKNEINKQYQLFDKMWLDKTMEITDDFLSLILANF